MVIEKYLRRQKTNIRYSDIKQLKFEYFEWPIESR